MDLPKARQIWHVYNRPNYIPKLYHPYDVTFLWDDRAVVVEGFYPYSRIQILDNDGKSLKTIAQGELMPFGVCIDAEGYMAVTDHRDRTVKFITPDGKFGLSWKSDMFDWPDGIATTLGGHYVVTDWTQGCVSVHDIEGIKLTQFPSTDSSDPQRSCPAYVTTDTHNRIIITDMYDCTVKIFDKNGQFLQKFGDSGDPSQCVNDPRGVCLDRSGNILVADWGNSSVAMFSSDGRFIQNILSEEDIRHPWGIATNRRGQLLLSEQKLSELPGLKLFELEV